jgi:hypothetical protein
MSSFTVRRSRNDGSALLWTLSTPTWTGESAVLNHKGIEAGQVEDSPNTNRLRKLPVLIDGTASPRVIS